MRLPCCGKRANSLLHGTTDIPVRSDTLSIFNSSGTKYIAFRKPFEIDGVDTRRERKLTAGVSLIR